jgi:hypothetical protein
MVTVPVVLAVGGFWAVDAARCRGLCRGDCRRGGFHRLAGGHTGGDRSRRLELSSLTSPSLCEDRILIARPNSSSILAGAILVAGALLALAFQILWESARSRMRP